MPRPKRPVRARLEAIARELHQLAKELGPAAAPKESPKVTAATSWLRANLTKPTPAADIVARAKAAGHSRQSLWLAKATLGVESTKSGATTWTWYPAPGHRRRQ